MRGVSASRVWAWGLLALCVSLAGCEHKPIVPDDLMPPQIDTANVPAFSDLIHRYNAPLEGVEGVFARTDVEVAWVSERGKPRRESGDGKLLFRRPLDTGVSVEAFGQTLMWAGSNNDYYWLFSELQDDGRLQFGQHRLLGHPGSGRLDLPIQPDTVPFLLGLMPLDPQAVPPPPSVELVNGYYLIEPLGLPLRMLLDPETARPVRVDLVDALGKSAVICRLDGAVRVQGTDLDLPERIDIYPVGREARMTLGLRSATADPKKLKDRLFDLDVLRGYYKPEVVVDLDAPVLPDASVD